MTMFTIIGTGAMALYFGARLAAAGEAVQFLGTWKEGLEAINQEGIRWMDSGEECVFPARAFSEPDDLKPTKAALVLVKSWQTLRAAGQLESLLESDGIALTLQNGLGNAHTLQESLGKERTAQGVTTYGATLLGPGMVRSGGEGFISVMRHSRLNELIESFRKGGLRVQVVDDLSSLVWGKLVINVAINPLSALLEVRNGSLLDNPAALEIMGRAALEAAAVAEKLGVRLSLDDPLQSVQAIARATSENYSSMLQDIKRGAPTEIDALCGQVVRWGQKLEQPTPINELLLLLIKAKVKIGKENKHANSN